MRRIINITECEAQINGVNIGNNNSVRQYLTIIYQVGHASI